MLDSIACLLVKGVGAVLCRLPPGFAVRLGRGIGAMVFWFQPKRVRVGVNNLLSAYAGRMTEPASIVDTLTHRDDLEIVVTTGGTVMRTWWRAFLSFCVCP